MEPAYVYRARPVRVVDGDTFVARVDLGFRVHVEVPIRLQGFDAPESREPGGPEATAALRALVMPDGVPHEDCAVRASL